MEYEEIRIPVPWGYVAGKWWGPTHSRPIICLHGWQDNAGTFDRLIPLLPKHIGMLALDLPGHGLSSRIPNGMIYFNFDIIILLKKIKKMYGWDKLSLMAHSFSSGISFIYTGLFPEDVDMLISIDSLKPRVKQADVCVQILRNDLTKFLIADERNQNNSIPPSYQWDEMIEKLHIGSKESVRHETAPYLLKRQTAKSKLNPNQYYFTNDNRIKCNIPTLIGHNVCVELAKYIKCPHLFLRALNDPHYENKAYETEIFNILKENNPNFEYHYIDSNHHLHLNEPELIDGIITNFLNKYKPEDNKFVRIKNKL